MSETEVWRKDARRQRSKQYAIYGHDEHSLSADRGKNAILRYHASQAAGHNMRSVFPTANAIYSSYGLQSKQHCSPGLQHALPRWAKVAGTSIRSEISRGCGYEDLLCPCREAVRAWSAHSCLLHLSVHLWRVAVGSSMCSTVRFENSRLGKESSRNRLHACQDQDHDCIFNTSPPHASSVLIHEKPEKEKLCLKGLHHRLGFHRSPTLNSHQWLTVSLRTSLAQGALLASASSSKMTSRSASPSEGEIVESDSEKATKSLPSARDTLVDRRSRKRSPPSRSPSPYRPARRHDRGSRSRSPYRADRRPKRGREDDHYSHRDERRNARSSTYRDGQDIRRSARQSSYRDGDRNRTLEADLRYDDHSSTTRSREKRPRTLSRSPPRFNNRTSDTRSSASARGDAKDGPRKWSKEQLVGDRRATPADVTSPRTDAEPPKKQAAKGVSFKLGGKNGSERADKYVPPLPGRIDANPTLLKLSNGRPRCTGPCCCSRAN